MTIETIRSDFALLDEWEDRYRYLIELGRDLPPFPEALRTDANKVRGCVSQVWLASAVKRNGAGAAPVLEFKGDSDAHIVRGLVAVLFALVGGRTPAAISGRRRQGRVRRAWPQGAPHPATLQRLLLHGGAHPRRRPRRRRRVSQASPRGREATPGILHVQAKGSGRPNAWPQALLSAFDRFTSP